MNTLHIIGRLGKDIECTPTNKGGIRGSFSVAVRKDYKNQNGEYESEWFHCSMYQENELPNGRVKTLEKLAGKGSRIAVTGSVSKNGDFLNVLVRDYEVLDYKEKTPEPKTEDNFFGDLSNNDNETISASDIMEDDLPF